MRFLFVSFFLLAPAAFAYLSPDREIPENVEIVKVRSEKDEILCQSSLIQDHTSSVSAAPCAGPAPCPQNLGLSAKQTFTAKTAKGCRVLSTPGGVPINSCNGAASSRPGSTPKPAQGSNAPKAGKTRTAVLPIYYGEDTEGKVRIVAIPDSPCRKGGLFYAKSREILVPIGKGDKTTLAQIRALENFHVGCKAVARFNKETAELLELTTRCNRISEAPAEVPSPPEPEEGRAVEAQ